jgi:hypothetical protein
MIGIGYIYHIAMEAFIKGLDKLQQFILTRIMSIIMFGSEDKIIPRPILEG